MAKASLAVGGEVDSWCTKCKLDLNHVIVTMTGSKPKRVKCLTCDGEHNFRAPGSGGKTTRKRKTTKRETKLAEVGSLPAEPYEMTRSYREADVIAHPALGRGVVVRTRGNKIDVEFQDGARVLVHQWSADA